MKKNSLNKRVICIVSVVAVVLALAIFILIPYINSIQYSKELAVNDLICAITYAHEFDEHAVEDVKDDMEGVIGKKRQEEACVEQLIAEIKKMNGSSGSVSLKIEYPRGRALYLLKKTCYNILKTLEKVRWRCATL